MLLTCNVFIDVTIVILCLYYILKNAFIGNEAKLIFDRYVDVTSQLKSRDYRSIFSLLLKRVGTILKVINSSLEVKPEPFRFYCRVTTDLIVHHLKFVRITPTLHQVC